MNEYTPAVGKLVSEDGKVRCKCGCGKVFKPFRHQVYYETKCRVRAWARSHPRVKVAVETTTE